MANKYIAFISYRHAELDSAIAKTLHSLIEQYRIPRGIRKDDENRLGVVFRDQEELHAASDLSSEIQNALNSTEYLIVICSKNSVESPWVTREVDHFLQSHDRSQVLTVLASGEPMEVFPPQLTRTPEGEIIEPLAVDVRADSIAASRKKLRRELPRLISAILRCPYDALVMREQRRKTRRITSIAAGAMAVLLGFTSTVLLKNQQIALANDQLEVKNTQLNTANTQLNQANTALEEQKAAVQLRESQLLVQSALEDLENGDYTDAIQKAVDALPADANDNRPYYAPAEQVLMEALGVFRTKEADPVLNTTVLEQVTDITDFVITEDGKRVVTTDEFGTVFCFDGQTGAQLWHQYAPQEDSGLSSVNPHLFLCNTDQAVIRSLKKTLNAYNLETGELLWSATTDSIVEDYLFYSKARNSLLFPVSYTTENYTVAYRLMEVDAATGETLQTIPLYDGNTSYSCIFSDSLTAALSRAGSFYADGTVFYGAFLDEDYHLHCFEADLTQGTSRTVYTSEEIFLSTGEVIGVFRDPDNGIYMVCMDIKQDVPVSALKIDKDTGEVLWQQDIPYPETNFLSLTEGTFAFRLTDTAFAYCLETSILIGCDNNFYTLDLQTGQILCTKANSSIITSMAFVKTNIFSYSLDDGTYAIGWVKSSDNSIVLSADQNLQVFANLDSHRELKVWGGGIVQLYMDATVFSLGVNNDVSPGSVLLIPAQHENQLHIIRPTQAFLLNTLTPTQIPGEDVRIFSDSTAIRVGSSLLVGRLYLSDGSASAYLSLDPDDGQTAELREYTGSSLSETLFWLPDTLQPLTSSRYGGIALINDDGTQTLLYDPDADQQALAAEDNWYSSITLFHCTSAYSADASTLWSAACNPKTLQVWTNGKLSAQADLPEHLLTDPKTSTSKERLLKIGANGRILVSLHEYQGSIPLENTAVYDPARNTWTTFQSDAVFSDGNSVAFAQENGTMAVIDQNGTVRILDLQTGNTTGSLSTQLPSGSVLQMRFFLDDTHLAIKATGGHLLIYEISTGTQVYRDQLSDAYSSTLQVFEDRQNERIYLVCGSHCGLCLERNSWTSLAKLNNLLYFDSNTNRIYLASKSYYDSAIYHGEIPDTMELVSLAKDHLANQQ